MEFAHPGLLLLGGLGAVPVVLHLLNRPKAEARAFPSLMFLARVARRERARSKLRNLLVLVLRVAAVVLLVAAVARPRLAAPGAGAGDAAAVFVIDDSFRLAALDGGFPRLQRARLLALDALEGLPPGTPAQAVCASLAGTDLTRDHSQLRPFLANLQPTWQHNDLAAALREAAGVLRRAAGGRRELYVVTDLSAAAWRTVPAGALTGIDGLSVTVLDAGAEAANAYVREIRAVPAWLREGREVEVRATLAIPAGAGPFSATLVADGRKVESKPAPAGGGAVAFTYRPSAAGPHIAEVRVEPGDALEADNVARAALHVRSRPRALVVEAPGAPPHLALGLAPPGLADAAPLTVVRVGPPELGACDPARFDVVFVADLDALGDDALFHLRRLRQAGRGVCAFRGAAAEDDPKEALRLKLAEPDHPLFRAFAGGRNGDLLGARFHRRPPPASADLAGGRTLALFTDGAPAVTAVPGAGGRFLLFHFAPRPEATSLTGLPCWVPLLQEAARWVEGADEPACRFVAGIPVSVPARGPEVVVKAWPAGPERRVQADPAARSAPAGAFPPGAYVAESGGARLAFAVNLDPAGSALERVAREDLEARLGREVRIRREPRGAAHAEERSGRELAGICLGVVAAALFAEPFFSNRGAAAARGEVRPV